MSCIRCETIRAANGDRSSRESRDELFTLCSAREEQSLYNLRGRCVRARVHLREPLHSRGSYAVETSRTIRRTAECAAQGIRYHVLEFSTELVYSEFRGAGNLLISATPLGLPLFPAPPVPRRASLRCPARKSTRYTYIHTYMRRCKILVLPTRIIARGPTARARFNNRADARARLLSRSPWRRLCMDH